MTSTMIFVSTSATGPAPGVPVPDADGTDSPALMTEFGLVDYSTGRTFHGVLVSGTVAHPDAAARPMLCGSSTHHDQAAVARAAAAWLADLKARPVLVSDNPAYDAMWMSHLFHTHLGTNPFGHSARRIGDFVAGLLGDWSDASAWKTLRWPTPAHGPVAYAQGNAVAMAQMAHYFAEVRRLPQSPVILGTIPYTHRARSQRTLSTFRRKAAAQRPGATARTCADTLTTATTSRA